MTSESDIGATPGIAVLHARGGEGYAGSRGGSVEAVQQEGLVELHARGLQEAVTEVRPASRWRWLLATLGVVCVVIAAAGAFIPLMPTTIFLIMACWCFARSCPWLEDRLVRNRFFRPFIKHLTPGAVMPTRVRWIVTAMIAMSCFGSAAGLIYAGKPWWVGAIGAALGVAGIVAVWRMNRPVPASRA
ncbi:MAG: YbaN family protein [Planctomycetota bacterium]|nr:YbaN family protein [Planctomycetota bacterium]